MASKDRQSLMTDSKLASTALEEAQPALGSSVCEESCTSELAESTALEETQPGLISPEHKESCTSELAEPTLVAVAGGAEDYMGKQRYTTPT